MLALVLFIFFVVDMAVWLLSLLGAIPSAQPYSPWLAFFACLILGVFVFFGVGPMTFSRL